MDEGEASRASPELGPLAAELARARAEQAAVTKLLRIVANTRDDPQAAFDAIVMCGRELFQGLRLSIRLVRGDVSQTVASSQPLRESFPLPLADRSIAASRAISSREVVHVPDTQGESALSETSITRSSRRGFRAIVSVPMMTPDRVVGAMSLTRETPGEFSRDQIALLQTFADQAVIAMENVRLFKEAQARNAELTESLAQQTATADILRIISTRLTDTQPALDAVTEAAARLCSANDVVLRLVDGEMHKAVAHFGSLPIGSSVAIARGMGAGRSIRESRTLHIHDVLADPNMRPGSDMVAFGVRTCLCVPLLREGKAVGAIMLRRLEVKPFTSDQIRLLETFAAQAVIAIENVRLFNELQARNTELTESLEQQTATAEILRAISQSPTDTQPVFEAIVHSGAQLFPGHDVVLRLVRGDNSEVVASTEAAHDGSPMPTPLNDERRASSRTIVRREVVEIVDTLEYEKVSEESRARRVARGTRAMLYVPLLRENGAIGALGLARATPGSFTRKQIEVMQTFAAQAVIAVENVRLFKELQARNAELTETLDQQTATNEILHAISKSPTDTQPVFEAIVQSGARLFPGHDVLLRLVQGDDSVIVANTEARYDGSSQPTPLDDLRRASTRAIVQREIVEIPEVLEYVKVSEDTQARHARRGMRAMLYVPMLRERDAIGALGLVRATPGAFTPKQIEVMQTFAAQAVIAVENVRLFKELEARNSDLAESLEQQAATSGILSVIAGSFNDVQPVFDAIARASARLFQGKRVRLYLVEGDRIYVRAGTAQEDVLQQVSLSMSDSVVAEAFARGEAVQIPDYSGHTEGVRSTSIAPLIRDGKPIGALTVPRTEPGVLPEKQMALLRTFADQAVIAIENARLFKEIQAKSEELEAANRHKSAFLANMSHELRTPLNAIIGIGELLEEDARDLNRDDELEPLSRILRAARHLLTLINDILDLSKIEAGHLDLHLDTVPVAPLLDEVRTTMEALATKNRNRLVVECEPGVDSVYADQLRLRQALLNLGSNANKFTENGEVSVATKREIADGRSWIVFAVADTGIGMTPQQMNRLFQDFVQTHDTSERKYGGTGLGLAITKRLCRMMGGDVAVQSVPGRGSVFTIRLPETAADFHGVWQPAGEEPDAGSADAERPLVLIADDDASVRQMFTAMLSREGFAVATATNGEEAIRLARALRPRAITLDILMPDIDGWEVLSTLKQDPELADTPVVLVSILDEREQGYLLGATDYMVKPVDRRKLVERLRQVCQVAQGRVLIVDDDDDLRRNLRKTLEQEGYSVDEAQNGVAALERLTACTPDAIVLDLIMPQMDGFDFADELHRRSELEHIPVIVLTAKDLTAEDRARLHGSVERILQKSGRPSALRATVEALRNLVPTEPRARADR
jgi:signal transduction histidine kinase/CheY-like chemotaxis protein